MFKRHKKIARDEEDPYKQSNILHAWPNLISCVEMHYKIHPAMKRHHHTIREPIELRYTEKFMKSLKKHCTTDDLKSKFVAALTKIVYKIPCGGLCNTAIKERRDLWHFYVSNFWRVFYRKKNDYILLEEFCPHKKHLYARRY